jgi:hypothetical protein
MFKTILSLWDLFSWFRKQRKEIEADAKEYFGAKRALKLRLRLERTFKALETGDLEHVPKWVQWLLGQTEVDNYIGLFGAYVLKSRKLWEDDPTLREWQEGKKP